MAGPDGLLRPTFKVNYSMVMQRFHLGKCKETLLKSPEKDAEEINVFNLLCSAQTRKVR